jgi:hypothetical protein
LTAAAVGGLQAAGGGWTIALCIRATRCDAIALVIIIITAGIVVAGDKTRAARSRR